MADKIVRGKDGRLYGGKGTKGGGRVDAQLSNVDASAVHIMSPSDKKIKDDFDSRRNFIYSTEALLDSGSPTSLRKKRIYDIRTMGLGANFDVSIGDPPLFGSTLKGICDTCGAKVYNKANDGFWIHKTNKGNSMDCPKGGK